MPRVNRTDHLKFRQVNHRDECFTRMDTIKKELKHYKKFFKGKTVYCNCDKWQKSNFIQYFKDNFFKLGLKRLIATHYVDWQGQLFPEQIPKHINFQGYQVLTETTNNAVKYVIEDTDTHKITHLKENGDFRSAECMSLLREADIVVTNPPFSLAQEFIETLLKEQKQFLVILPIDIVSRSTIFPYFKDGKLWNGVSRECMEFDSSDETLKLCNVRWFTNLDHKQHPQPFELTESYDPERYPQYSTHDAIECQSIRNVPKDYDGLVGVSVPLLVDLYSPEQFELVDNVKPTCKGIRTYQRILIRNRQYNAV